MLTVPDSKVHGANMGPIWGRQDPGGPHVGPMNSAIWGVILIQVTFRYFGKIVSWFVSKSIDFWHDIKLHSLVGWDISMSYQYMVK